MESQETDGNVASVVAGVLARAERSECKRLDSRLLPP
jgi:hypothetical protein